MRRLLGIDYGHIETVLPSNRLDGANEPYSIAMFPGWFSLPALPAIVVSILSGCALGVVYAVFESVLGEKSAYHVYFLGLDAFDKGLLVAGLLPFILAIFYRLMLLDDHENFRLILAVFLSHLFFTPLKSRIGHVLYRLRLSFYEAERLGIKLEPFFPILVAIEDSHFKKHNGNSYLALSKSIYRLLRDRSPSGSGSTIYQQLSRSNFVNNFSAVFRRKCLEWLLAPWLNVRFSKEDGLRAYICSVRYAKGVIGVVQAIAHYFPDQKVSDPLSKAQMFFLIERLAMVSGRFNPARVLAIVARLKEEQVLSDEDEVEVFKVYADMSRRALVVSR